MLEEPTAIKILGGYRFKWQELKLQICVSRIRESKDGTVKGEILVESLAEGNYRTISQSQHNFTAPDVRGKLAEYLQKRHPITIEQWLEILEQLSNLLLQKHRKGEPVSHITTEDKVLEPEYLVRPILPLKQPTVIFGDGGVGKSYISLCLAVCTFLPWKDNPLNLTVRENSVKVLYLDWEADDNTVRWRLNRLKTGLGLPYLELDYLRCSQVFADDIEHIQDKINNTGAEFIIIDSLAGACGGDLTASEPATRFYNALRTLDVTPLIIAHNPKGDGKKTIYGSAIFEHRARSVWECRAIHEPGEDELLIGLFHHKSNNSKLFTPLGFKFQFDSTATKVSKHSLEPSFGKAPTLESKIEEALQEAPMTVKELTAKVGGNPDSVSVYVSKMKGKGLIHPEGGKLKWAN